MSRPGFHQAAGPEPDELGPVEMAGTLDFIERDRLVVGQPRSVMCRPIASRRRAVDVAPLGASADKGGGGVLIAWQHALAPMENITRARLTIHHIGPLAIPGDQHARA